MQRSVCGWSLRPHRSDAVGHAGSSNCDRDDHNSQLVPVVPPAPANHCVTTRPPPLICPADDLHLAAGTVARWVSKPPKSQIAALASIFCCQVRDYVPIMLRIGTKQYTKGLLSHAISEPNL